MDCGRCYSVPSAFCYGPSEPEFTPFRANLVLTLSFDAVRDEWRCLVLDTGHVRNVTASVLRGDARVA